MIIFIFNHWKNIIILLGWVQTSLANQNVSSFLQYNSFVLYQGSPVYSNDSGCPFSVMSRIPYAFYFQISFISHFSNLGTCSGKLVGNLPGGRTYTNNINFVFDKES